MVPEMSRQFFKHDALDNSRKEIRLVRILHEQATSDRINCELRHADLSVSPEYRALSYTWGDVDSWHPIMIAGQTFHIRKNLHDFMTTTKLECWLWVDQICINQESIDERSRQVSMMENIYRQAEEVIIWLGIKQLDVELLAHLRTYGPNIANPRNDSISDDKDIQLFNALSETPYWTRLWIVQEILLARSIRMLWSFHEIDTECLKAFAFHMMFCRDATLTPLSDISVLRPIWRLLCQRARAFHNEFQFVELLEDFSSNVCSDARDHVFGLYALFPPHIKDILKVDYSLDTEAVFMKVMDVLFDERWEDWWGLQRQIRLLMQAMFPDVWGLSMEIALNNILASLGPPIFLLPPPDFSKRDNAIKAIGGLVQSSP